MWPPVRIAGTGSFLPDNVITNDDLVDRGLETTDEWIVEHTGIRERCWADVNTTTAQLAAQAAKNALDSAEAYADEIDLLILTTSTPDWQQPATASAVHELLGLRADAGAFDLNAVCSGFVYALQAGSSMLAGSEAWMSVLVVGAERYSSITDPNDRTTRIFFGDGAGAVLLRKELEVADLAAAAAAEAGINIGDLAHDGGALDEESSGIRSIAYAVDHSGKDALLTPHASYFQMDGPAVRKFAVPALVDAVRRACRDAHIEVFDLNFLVPHQSNQRILEAAIDELDLPQARLALTVDKYANTAAASIPITLDTLTRSGKLCDGDLICLAGYGSGLQSAACIVRWSS